jgi:hypothetical protein
MLDITNLTTDELLANMDKEALREIFVTLAATFSFDIPDRAKERGFFRLESLFEGIEVGLLHDRQIMQEANNLAVELDAPGY